MLQGKIEFQLNKVEAACESFYIALQTFTAFYTGNIDELKKSEDLAFWLNHLEDEKMAIEMQIHQYCP